MTRIQNYFNGVADMVTARSLMSRTANHRPDIGLNRENALKTFLVNHLPKRLYTTLGGQIIDVDGLESGQIDIIIHNDIGIRFEENERTFITAESVAGVITIKSTLDGAGLLDSLNNLATIPEPNPLALEFKSLNKNAFDGFRNFHPSRHIFAFDGFSAELCLERVMEYYSQRPEIPIWHYPHNIIVNCKYMISYSQFDTESFNRVAVPKNSFYLTELVPSNRGYPFVCLLNDLTSYLDWLNHMTTHHYPYFNNGFKP